MAVLVIDDSLAMRSLLRDILSGSGFKVVEAGDGREALECLKRGDDIEAVLVDASALVRFDSSALAVLLECRREALHDGKGFGVRGLAPRLQALAQLYGVAELLNEAPLASEPAESVA